MFEHCSDVIFRDVTLQGDTKLLLIYLDGMIDKDIIQSVILKPLMYEGIPQGIGPIDSIAQMCDQQLFA
ncbi:Spore germination protein KA, partial [Mortierella sp. GBA39]